jgi:superfamily I DNA/RNA helicase
VYRFEDPEQNIHERIAEPTALEQTFVLSRNVRCTRQIAARLDAIWGVHRPAVGPHGPEPRLIAVEDTDSLRQSITNELHRLLNKGRLRPDQIVILSSATSGVDRVLGFGELLGHPLWRAEQGVADTRAGRRPGGALQVETVHRFKGLEADAAILLLDEVETLRERRVAYVGMGRARSVLTVIGPPQLAEALHWPLTGEPRD